ETTAGELARHFPITGAAVSYHLAQLKKADLVCERREKNFIYYALNTTMLGELMLWLDQFRLPDKGAGAAGEGAEP
ncbi:MAG TPA: helix-turn-helix transcriptional regulator, partial [Candidatus Galloscillospira excrementavium]|nr:helix-turn-helix transcriptional regulator [Candidatus Galloscillospira excrementavium]